MSSADLGLLVMAATAWGLAGIVFWATRRRGRDRIFSGITPGQLPASGQPVKVNRVGPGREYSGSVAVAYQPPRGVPPALASGVVHGRVESRDITATIMDLAVRRYLRLSPVDSQGNLLQRADESDDRRGGPRDRTDWMITKIRPATARPGEQPLLPYEERLLIELFASRRTIRMSELGQVNPHVITATVERIHQQMVDLHWYDKHPQRRGKRTGILALLASVLMGCLFLAASAQIIWGALAGILLVCGGFTMKQALSWRTPRTAEGTAAMVQVKSFGHYLATAEADQIRFEEAAEIFSRYLPYAIALGEADHWAKTFGDVVRRAERAGVTLPMNDMTWMDDVYFTWLITDLAVEGGSMLFDLLGQVDVVDLVSGAADGLGSLAEGLGDFLGDLDL